MGALCNCDAKSQSQNSMYQGLSHIRDPRLADLSTHIKILEAKLNSNISAIDDFKQLLIETKKESPNSQMQILATINQVEDALNEAKKSLELVSLRKNQAKQMME